MVLDARDLDAKTAEAMAAGTEATIASAQAALRKATADLERVRGLAAKQIVPAQQLDAAQGAFDGARAARDGLLPHLDAADPQVQGWLQQVTASLQHLGASTQQAQARALEILSLKLQQQAALLAYDRIYLIMGVLFTCALPLLLLFRTGRVAGGGDAH